MLAIGALIALIAASLLATQMSSPSEATAKRSTHVSTVLIRGIARENSFPKLVFDGPETISRGDVLRVKSLTDGRKVGPHTFSLVRRQLLPNSRSERRSCFAPGKICRKIALWHGSDGESPPSEPDSETGRRGWDWEGDRGDRKGDSWYTGVKRGNGTRRVVSAPVGTTLHFMCAIHPNMHGQIKVTR